MVISRTLYHSLFLFPHENVQVPSLDILTLSLNAIQDTSQNNLHNQLGCFTVISCILFYYCTVTIICLQKNHRTEENGFFPLLLRLFALVVLFFIYFSLAFSCLILALAYSSSILSSSSSMLNNANRFLRHGYSSSTGLMVRLAARWILGSSLYILCSPLIGNLSTISCGFSQMNT